MSNMDYLNALKTATDLKQAWGDTNEYHKWLKRQYKKYGTYAAQQDKLAHSIGDGTMFQRFHADTDGEGWYWYGFVTPYDMVYDYDKDEFGSVEEVYLDLTDDEIDEWFEENMAIRIHSDYDCTGRSFTRWIDWHRNPDGSISYVHSVGIDV